MVAMFAWLFLSAVLINWSLGAPLPPALELPQDRIQIISVKYQYVTIKLTMALKTFPKGTFLPFYGDG